MLWDTWWLHCVGYAGTTSEQLLVSRESDLDLHHSKLHVFEDLSRVYHSEICSLKFTLQDLSYGDLSHSFHVFTLNPSSRNLLLLTENNKFT
jgi:hypothetical protein